MQIDGHTADSPVDPCAVDVFEPSLSKSQRKLFILIHLNSNCNVKRVSTFKVFALIFIPPMRKSPVIFAFTILQSTPSERKNKQTCKPLIFYILIINHYKSFYST